MYFDRRLWALTRGLRGRIALAIGLGVCASGFGIARIVTDQIGFSRTLSVRGTLPYMSPQQIAGEPADEQSDIYSLGVMAYEMLTGDPPFVRGDVAYQHTYKAPAPPSESAEGIPPRLEAVVMRCLEKKLAARYRTTREILADLQ